MADEPKQSCDNLEQWMRQGEEHESLLEAVARCLADDVKRFALSRCGGARQDIEDISQDAMLAAQQYLSTFRGEASLRTWMYKLVLSACSHRRRGRKNDPYLHRPLDEAPITPGDPSDPEVVLLMSERLSALQQAMDDLRDEDRQLLASAEWEALSMEEVALRYGLTVPAVKSRLFRIRKQLKDLVQARFSGNTAANTE